MNHEISILIPVYNDWIYLEEILLPSLKYEKKIDIELIIVDDGSDPKYEDIKNRIFQSKDFSIKHLELKKNSGANVARNLAFNLSSGKYVMFSDADIRFFPETFKKMKEVLDRKDDISFVYSNFFWKSEVDGRLVPMKAMEWDPRQLCIRNYVSFCSLIRKEDAKEVMPLDTGIERLQDWDFWLSMMEKNFIGKYINEFLFIAMLKERGISNQSPENYVKWHNIVLQKHMSKKGVGK